MADNPYSDLLPEQDDNPYSDLVPGTPIEAHENFLQKAIKANRVNDNPIAPTGMLPTNGQEALDIGRSAINMNTPSGWMGPMATGASLMDGKPSGLQMPNQIQQMLQPQTQFGKVFNEQAKEAPMAALALEGIPALIGGASKGLNALFNPGSVSKDIESTKGSIKDLIRLGPGKVKQGVGDIFNQFQSEFGDRLKNIPDDLEHAVTNDNFADVMEKTANELGATDIAGSPGNRAMQHAQVFRQTPRAYGASDIQAQTKQILNSLPDTMSKAKFYNHFTEMLSQMVPELSNLKSEYAPVYDIAKQSKNISKSSLALAASGQIGPEELGNMTQAQQMMGDEPNIVEQTVNAGDKLRSQQNDLQKIMGRQNTAKGILKKGALGVGLEELMRHLFFKSPQ